LGTALLGCGAVCGGSGAAACGAAALGTGAGAGIGTGTECSTTGCGRGLGLGFTTGLGFGSTGLTISGVTLGCGGSITGWGGAGKGCKSIKVTLCTAGVGGRATRQFNSRTAPSACSASTMARLALQRSPPPRAGIENGSVTAASVISD